MPRPAIMRISVAMIGWMPMTATRKPFHSAEQQRQPERRGDRHEHAADAALVGAAG